MRALRPLLGWLAAGLLAGAAWAQHPAIGEAPPRPLHERLAGADAVGLGRVERVGTGRIRLVDVSGVLGDLPAALELKRAPSDPPGLAAGERLLLLLRGARSPYLLVDGPREIARIGPDADEAVLGDLLRALHAAASDAERARIYARWVERPDAGLPGEPARGLADTSLDVGGVDGEVFERLAARACDPSVAAAPRLDAARAAVRHPLGSHALLGRLPGDDPGVLAVGLAAAMPAHPALGVRVLDRALRHDDPRMREAALRATVAFDYAPPVRARVATIAADDPEPALRDLARRVMRAGSSALSSGSE